MPILHRTDMPKFPKEPFHEGDTVIVIEHEETRTNTSYAHLVGKHATVINPAAGTDSGGRAESLILVQFENGDLEGMFHWRFNIVKRQATWEV